jgi:hypothetical protein
MTLKTGVLEEARPSFLEAAERSLATARDPINQVRLLSGTNGS